MPEDKKKVLRARCHICGQKINFTNGNPQELVQHMVCCHNQGSVLHYNPSCCTKDDAISNIKVINCPNKTKQKTKKKCSHCSQQHNKTKNSPDHVTVCMPSIGGASQKVHSETKTSNCPPKCALKGASKQEHGRRGSGRNSFDGTTKRVPSDTRYLDRRRSRQSNTSNCDPCNNGKRRYSNSESNHSNSSLNSCKKSDHEHRRRSVPKNKSFSERQTISTCKSVCFNETLECPGKKKSPPCNGKCPQEYDKSNLKKRKGTKEMYKTTVETWTAGCGYITCPKCKKKVIPLVRKQKNKVAFTSVGASFLLTCWPFCFLLPMLHNCSVDLYCPCCKFKLGVYDSASGKTTPACCKSSVKK